MFIGLAKAEAEAEARESPTAGGIAPALPDLDDSSWLRYTPTPAQIPSCGHGAVEVWHDPTSMDYGFFLRIVRQLDFRMYTHART